MKRLLSWLPPRMSAGGNLSFAAPYLIFRHRTGHLAAVYEGWSWSGFLYGPLWALRHRLWKVIAYFSIFSCFARLPR